MDKRQRLTLLGIAMAIAAVTAVIAVVSGGGNDEKTDSTQAAGTPAETQSQSQTATAPNAPVKAPEAPAPEEIRVKGGEVVGGTAEIEIEKGDRALIDVRADEADEAHLHGYDLTREVGPGKTGRFRFRASFEGIYELELHHRGTQLARVTVKP